VEMGEGRRDRRVFLTLALTLTPHTYTQDVTLAFHTQHEELELTKSQLQQATATMAGLEADEAAAAATAAVRDASRVVADPAGAAAAANPDFQKSLEKLTSGFKLLHGLDV
jgi:hypothetical protein